MESSRNAGADEVLTGIVEYISGYKIENDAAFDSARLCLNDTLACGLDALDFSDCTTLLGPIVPGTKVPYACRLPGTRHELDPVTAAFNLGCMIRWLDLNDAFTAATGGHLSDNVAGILMMAEHLSRERTANGREPIVMREVLDLLIRAYEIQGCLSIENDFFLPGNDHNVLVRVATAGVLTRLLGGNRDQIMSAVSNAWIDSSLVVYRHAPDTGSRKNWASGDASAQAVRLAMMAMKGEMAYPHVLTAKRFGFYDARMAGRPFTFQRPYADYVIQNSMFKFVAAGMHSQSAIEAACKLHAAVRGRLDDIERVEITAHRENMRIMHKTGPLHNPSDRDHCAEYVVALGLIYGRIDPKNFEDDFAADPRIDKLRARMTMKEDAAFTRDFDDPSKRASPNAVQVWFRDASSTAKVTVEYPLGHKRRRADGVPALRAKFATSLERRYPREQQEKLLRLYDDRERLHRMPVHEFVDMFIP